MVKRKIHHDGSTTTTENADSDHAADYHQTRHARRGLRSSYLAIKNRIHDEKDEIASPESKKFDLIFGQMESLHQLVTKPREQVADAQALLDITKSLVVTARAHGGGGLTPSSFVTHMLKEFGGKGGGATTSPEDCSRNLIAWKDIGVAVSYVFGGGYGCSTMIGPIDAKIKQRKVIKRRKQVKSIELARPEELGGGLSEEKTDTDKNMLTMFNILKKNRVVRLENLVLNRNSFAQTVENLFALSFLVKDGRAEIRVNEAGQQLVLPRNAPAANAVLTKDVAFSHFVFRFDFNDWKLMVSTVGVGEELMPDRNSQWTQSQS